MNERDANGLLTLCKYVSMEIDWSNQNDTASKVPQRNKRVVSDNVHRNAISFNSKKVFSKQLTQPFLSETITNAIIF